MKVHIASSMARLGSATIMLSSYVLYHCSDLHCCRSHNLSQTIFLLSSGAYKSINMHLNSGNIANASPLPLSWSV